MMTNEELYALCDALCYRVREVPLKSAPAAALPGGCIAVNSERIPNPAAEKEILHGVNLLVLSVQHPTRESPELRWLSGMTSSG